MTPGVELATQFSETDWADACTPEPDTGIFTEAVDALLVMEMLPDRFAAEVGRKVTSKVAVCEGPRIKPAETPLVVKTALGVVTLEIVMSEFPELVSKMLSELLAPTVTLPNPRLEGLVASCRLGAAPVPLRASASGEFEALL